MALREQDPDIYRAMEQELERQRQSLELIASENFVSPAVMEAMGSVLTNKYSEGYPGKRYYGGNQFIDQTEGLAIDRAKRLFKAEHANVQPHSGSQANMAAYMATISPGDTIMSLNLSHGGHLSHGAPVNFSGKLYKIASYSLDPTTELIDMDAVRKQAMAEKPKLLLAGHSAYPRLLDFKEFGEIAKDCGAIAMADVAHVAGLIVGGAHPEPFPYMDIVTTTTHKTLRGPRGAIILSKQQYGQAIDKAVFPGMQGGPLDHVVAAKAVAFSEALRPEFSSYAKQVVRNAKALADAMLGLGYRLVSGGTDNHLMLVDLRSKNTTGREAEQVLEKVDISLNRNMIPGDPQPPYIASGIRIGTPALTTRGMGEKEMREAAALIDRAITGKNDAAKLEAVKKDVHALCARFPLYKGLKF